MINVRSLIVLAVPADRLFPLTVAAVTLLTELTRMAADTMPMEAEAAILPMEPAAAAAVAILEVQATPGVTLLAVLTVPEVTVVVALMADQTVTLAAVAAAQAATIDQRLAPTDLVMLAEMPKGPKILTTRALDRATLLQGLAIMALALREPEGARPIMVAPEPRQQGTPTGTTAPQVHATLSTADSSRIREYCLPFEPFTSARCFDNCFVRASDFLGTYFDVFLYNHINW